MEFAAYRSKLQYLFISFLVFKEYFNSNLFVLSHFSLTVKDIVDIKPANMEELTEVITSAEFHPDACNIFVYSSSKGTARLCDMRDSALCDKYSKCKLAFVHFYFTN